MNYEKMPPKVERFFKGKTSKTFTDIHEIAKSMHTDIYIFCLANAMNQQPNPSSPNDGATSSGYQTATILPSISFTKSSTSQISP